MDGGSRKSIFYGKNSGVSFANAKIIGPLEWRGVKAKLSMLNLSNAKVSLLKTDKGESWPRTLILDNFFYDDIDHGFNSGSTAIYLKWLNKQENYNPQIYEQLATVLSRKGQDKEAKIIRIKSEYKRCEKDSKYKRAWNWFLKKIATVSEWLNIFQNLSSLTPKIMGGLTILYASLNLEAIINWLHKMLSVLVNLS
jgi:hypothetical protein